MQRDGDPSDERPGSDVTEGPGGLSRSPWVRGAYFAAGVFFTGLGVIGAFLPLLPTTIFLIVAAGCFGRSSPRFEAYLLDHPRFGPPLRAWRRHGAISRRAKLMAFTGMAVGYAVFAYSAAPRWPTALIVGAVMLGSAIYVGTRPESA